MYRSEMQKLEGVWTGIERIESDEGSHEAHGRWEFHTVFDGRFLLCDYVQTSPDRPPCVGHAVFRKDDRTQTLTVSWFRSPMATPYQQIDGVSEGDRLCFYEKQGDTSTRTLYGIHPHSLTISTERSVRGGEWQQVFQGSYRRPHV